MNTVLRSLAAVALFGISVSLTAIVLWDAVRIGAASDAALIAKFDGAAYEDIFGLGFWVTWIILTLIQLVAIGGGWFAIGRQRLRLAAPVLLFAFAFASNIAYLSFERQHSLWEAHYR